MGMWLCFNRFTEFIEKKTRKSQENDTNKRFNGILSKMCFLGRPHLKNEGKFAKDIKN